MIVNSSFVAMNPPEELSLAEPSAQMIVIDFRNQ
jgi:hypothetical protein